MNFSSSLPRFPAFPIPALAIPALRRSLRAVAFGAALLGAVVPPGIVMAQDQGDGTYVINLRETDISVLAEQVSTITGRTLVIDPALAGDVTVVSVEPLDEDGVWELFQSILGVRGFVAVQSGAIWEVIPEAQARSKGGQAETRPVGSQDTITQLLRLNRLPAEEAVRVLRPLVAEAGYIEALTDPNAVVITDTRANVERILNIARVFDGEAAMQAEVIRFNFAQAASVGAAIVEVLGDAGTGARLSVDAASNVLLVRGTENDILQIRALARAMDVAPRRSPTEESVTTVFRLKYGDAEVVAEVLRGTLQGGTAITNPVADNVGAADPAAEGAAQTPAPASSASAPVGNVSIQASTETNSIIARGTARQVKDIGKLIGALDVRRAQVMIEAAIVEVSGEIAERLGVQLGLDRAAPPGGIAATSFSNAGTSLQSILLALGATSGAALSTGLTLGVSNNDFGALVQALAQSTSANLLSTPSVTTMDNQPATIVVGQNVPFRTGSFGTNGNTVTPFTTIERRDVGITMNVLPRVTAGNVVRLEIAQEVSSLVGTNVEGAADLITNRRVINTTVLADDGGTVVLGGLITDDQTATKGKVPVLGDLPVVGNLFKSRQKQQTQRTLFVFMRPTILRSHTDLSQAANRSYNKLKSADRADPPKTLLKERKVEKLPLEINGLY